MTQKEKTGVGQDEQGTDLAALTGFDRGHGTAWLRAHGMKNIDENAGSVITDASDRVNLRSARR